MTEPTALDTAHAAMEAAPEDEAARLRFYERLADGELFLLLAQEASGDDIVPELFDLSDSRFVLVFDREERLTAFTTRAAPYAALPGRAIAGMLAGKDIGLGLNLEVAPSSILIPGPAVDWLAATLGKGPEEAAARPVEVLAPRGLPESLIRALDTKLGLAVGTGAHGVSGGGDLRRRQPRPSACHDRSGRGGRRRAGAGGERGAGLLRA